MSIKSIKFDHSKVYQFILPFLCEIDETKYFYTKIIFNSAEKKITTVHFIIISPIHTDIIKYYTQWFCIICDVR